MSIYHIDGFYSSWNYSYMDDMLEHYLVPHQNHYEERFRALQKIIDDHKDAATFEDFVTQVRI